VPEAAPNLPIFLSKLPTKFQFALNVKNTKTPGFDLPATMMGRAKRMSGDIQV
jgi:hypothetical protein